MTIARDIQKLSGLPPAEKRLEPAATPLAKRTQTGLEPVIRPASGGNIASPLTETDYAEREYWPDQTIVSSDGVFSVTWKPIMIMKFTDANDEPVIMEYKEPV